MGPLNRDHCDAHGSGVEGLGKGLPQGVQVPGLEGRRSWLNPGTEKVVVAEAWTLMWLHELGCRWAKGAGVHSWRCPPNRVLGATCTDACHPPLPPTPSRVRSALPLERDHEARCFLLTLRSSLSHPVPLGSPPFPSQVHSKLITEDQV